MPKTEELSSLIDPDVTLPALPVGHPFTQISANYWASNGRFTTLEDRVTVDLDTGTLITAASTDLIQVWCVRGGV
jgi:hypothetical protein